MKKPPMLVSRPYRALGWLTLGGRQIPILPRLSILYFLVFIVLLLISTCALEWRLAALSDRGLLNSQAWKVANQLLYKLDQRKVHSTYENPLWFSDGIPFHDSGKRRILVIGDSFVWGDGSLNCNDLWWRQLERALHHAGYWNVEVIAAGLNGASTQDELYWLKDLKLIERVKPDVIVIGYVTNDPDCVDAEGRHYVPQNLSLQPKTSRPSSLAAHVFPQLTFQIDRLLSRRNETMHQGGFDYADWELKILEGPNIQAYQKVLMELGEFLKQSGVPYLAVTLPNQPDPDFWRRRYAVVSPLFQNAGIPFHDLSPAFLNEYGSGGNLLRWAINPANGHPGPLSTSFYARQVSALLIRTAPSALGALAPPPINLKPEINDWMPPTLHPVQIGESEWILDYSNDTRKNLPVLPLRKPFSMLAFREPVAIRRVEVSGARLRRAELFLQEIDPSTGAARWETTSLGTRRGTNLAWDLGPNEQTVPLNALMLNVDFNADLSSKLRIRITSEQKAVLP